MFLLLSCYLFLNKESFSLIRMRVLERAFQVIRSALIVHYRLGDGQARIGRNQCVTTCTARVSVYRLQRASIRENWLASRVVIPCFKA